LLGPLEIRAWGWAVIGRDFCTLAVGLGGVIARGLIVCRVRTCFASAFAAVTAVAVARAAFTALIVLSWAGTIVCRIGVSVLICAQCRFRRLAIGGIAWAALSAFATFTAAFTCAFTPAFATFTAAITGLAWGAFLAHFAAIGIQLGLGIAAAFAQAVGALAFSQVVTAWARTAITAAFTGRAITAWALAALTAFTTLRAFTTL
jgi:hypothetical protein